MSIFGRACRDAVQEIFGSVQSQGAAVRVESGEAPEGSKELKTAAEATVSNMTGGIVLGNALESLYEMGIAYVIELSEVVIGNKHGDRFMKYLCSGLHFSAFSLFEL